MTKARRPNTFQDALTRAAGLLTNEGVADACGKSVRTVYAYGDPDLGRCPSIDDCLAIDAAYLKAGGGEAPFLAVYEARLERMSAPPADCTVLARATATAARETGEAVAALVVASMPGAPVRDRIVAEKEVAEAVEALHDVQRKLGCPGEVVAMRGAA